VGIAVFAARGGFSDGPAPAPSASAVAPTPSANATGPVTVSAPPSASTAVTALCGRLVGTLPRTLDGRPLRPVSAAPDRVVAWGSPPVVLTCGVAPVTVPPDTNKQFQINGVRWYAETRGSAVVFTTTDRTVPVEVTVPATTAGNPADVPAELSGPIGRTIPAKG
jgi:hypothetical protein